MSKFTGVNPDVLMSGNQLCLLMVPVWVADAMHLIKSANREDDALCSKVRMKYVISHFSSEIRTDQEASSCRNLNSLEELIDFISPYLFKEGDIVEIRQNGREKIYRYQSIKKFDDAVYFAFDDGDSDAVYFSTENLRDAKISRGCQLPENFGEMQRARRSGFVWPEAFPRYFNEKNRVVRIII